MTIGKICKLFRRYSCAVFGAKGTGKDVLMGNVISRRKLPYVSNTYYGGEHIPFQYKDIACGNNRYRDFIHGTVKKYDFPYPDKTDFYLADIGVYFPSQYCNELNKEYPQVAVFEALSRQLGDSKLHYNTQAINRAWDKIREQCEQYIMCICCYVVCGFVIQIIRIYEKYDSACSKVLPWRIRLPLFATKEMRLSFDLARQQYENSHGKIRQHVLIYRNKSKHDTRMFKEVLANGI